MAFRVALACIQEVVEIMKLCNDCKYPERNALGDATDTSECRHTKSTNTHVNPVSGQTKTTRRGCLDMRLLFGIDADHQGCGMDAVLFEPRE